MDHRRLPKVELHSHLDCCLSYKAAHEIDPTVTREQYAREFVAPARCASLAEYLTYTVNYRDLLQTERALRICVRDVFEQMAEDGVVYAELRFAPLAQTDGGLTGDEVVSCVSDETARQIEAAGIDASLILCTLRHFNADRSLETARLLERHTGLGPVAALDIAGDEAGYPLAPHVAAFAHARERGFDVTVHAGEAAGPESVWEALDQIGTRRIGHGIRSLEDARLTSFLKAEGVHLEICPASNVQTGTVRAPEQHPVDRLYRDGLDLGISTDTRAVTDITLTREYEHLTELFGWTTDDLERINRNALDAAFAAPAVKERVGRALDATYTRDSG